MNKQYRDGRAFALTRLGMDKVAYMGGRSGLVLNSDGSYSTYLGSRDPDPIRLPGMSRAVHPLYLEAAHDHAQEKDPAASIEEVAQQGSVTAPLMTGLMGGVAGGLLGARSGTPGVLAGAGIGGAGGALLGKLLHSAHAAQYRDEVMEALKGVHSERDELELKKLQLEMLRRQMAGAGAQ